MQLTASHRPRLFLFALLSVALLLRIYHFRYPAWDYFGSRQTLNLMLVRGYLDHGISLFHPTIDWLTVADPSRPSYFCYEFPWLHALAAIEMRLLSAGDWCARLIPLVLSLAGLWWIYDLTRRLIGEWAARFAALAWAVIPFSIFFGRAFMSDMPALSLATGTLDVFDSWLETRRPSRLLAAALLGSVALLTKPHAAALGVAMGYLAILTFRWRVVTQWRLYCAAVVIVLPAAWWIRHTERLVQAGGPAVIGAGAVGRSMYLWLHASAWYEECDRMFREVLGPVGLALTLVGFLWPSRNPRHYLFHAWFLASALFLFLIPEAMVGSTGTDYYLLLLVPPATGLIGIALGNLYEHAPARMTAIWLIIALVLSSILAALPRFRSDELHFHIGQLLNRLTRPNDLVATAAGGAADTLYFSGRRGWEASLYDLPRLEELSLAGARIFAMADPDAIQINSALIPLLDHRFVRLTRDDLEGTELNWMIWSLDPAETHPDMSGTERPTPAISFGRKVGLLNASVRELLIWPASFEATYHWECLSRIEANLRAFVHVTTPGGNTVFQQDHWPLSGHLPTQQWNVGDLIRERYVLVLPAELPPGRYQLRIGWFDPSNGSRLHVAPGGDGEDRAIVSEFYVHTKPASGWVRSPNAF